MTAGLIVTLIGVALAFGAALEISQSWATALIGAVLFGIGALRWAIGRGGVTPSGGKP